MEGVVVASNHQIQQQPDTKSVAIMNSSSSANQKEDVPYASGIFNKKQSLAYSGYPADIKFVNERSKKGEPLEVETTSSHSDSLEVFCRKKVSDLNPRLVLHNSPRKETVPSVILDQSLQLKSQHENQYPFKRDPPSNSNEVLSLQKQSLYQSLSTRKDYPGNLFVHPERPLEVAQYLGRKGNGQKNIDVKLIAVRVRYTVENHYASSRFSYHYLFFKMYCTILCIISTI